MQVAGGSVVVLAVFWVRMLGVVAHWCTNDVWKLCHGVLVLLVMMT